MAWDPTQESRRDAYFVMNRVLAAVIFLLAAVVLLWKPLILAKAPLPGQYLKKMQPWVSTQNKSDSHIQWNPLSWDAIGQFYPWRVFLGRSLHSGKIPLWNPHQFCGNPFLANGQSAVLYPPNWLFAIIDPIWAFTLIALFHLAAAGFFTYLFLKDLSISDEGAIIAGLSFELCAFLVLWMELPTLLTVAVWLPCALWTVYRAITRRSYAWAVVSAVVLSLAVLAGHLQIAFYVWFAVVLWALYLVGKAWRADKRITSKYACIFVFTLLLGAVLSAAQILPSIELGRLSHRQIPTSMEDYHRFAANGLPVHRLVTAVIPDYFGNPNQGNYFLLGRIGERFNMPADYLELGLYSGLLTLAAAFIALLSWRKNPHVCFWTALGAISMLVAAGSYINLPMYFGIPGFSALGGPNRILVLYMFALSVLAGYGVDYLCSSTSHKLPLFGGKLKLGTAFALLSVAVLGVFTAVSMGIADTALAQLPQQLRDIIPGVQSGAVLRYAIMMIATTVVLLLGGSGVVSKRIFGIVAVIVLAVDLLGWGMGTIPECDRKDVYPDTALTNYLKDHTERRVLPTNSNWSLTSFPLSLLPPNAAMVYGFYDVQGYDSLYTKAYKDYMTTDFATDPCPPENGNMILGKATSKSALGLSVALADSAPKGNVLYRSNRIAVTDTGFADAGWIAQLNGEPVDTNFIGPNRVTVQLPDAAKDIVTVRVLNYPGWKNSKTNQDIDPDGIWMSCPASGERVVDLMFQPESYQVGLFISLIGLSICMGSLTYSRLNLNKGCI